MCGYACSSTIYRHTATDTMPTPGMGQIWMSNVMCGTDDTSLDECPFAGWGAVPSQCTHSMDVQLACQGISHQIVICVLYSVVFFTGILQSMCDSDEYKCDISSCTITVMPDCGSIPLVENSTPIQNSERVTYTCLDGFTLSGSPTLTCLANETWSPSPPICNGMQCFVVCML